MASIPQIRGALLEEVVLYFLVRSGYQLVGLGEDGTRNGRAGLEVRGRGTWHQIDALAVPIYSPAFMHPLRLLLEAKCYEGRPVDIRTLRAVVGTLLDINQNYFSEDIKGFDVQIQRYNYHAAVFSASGYTEGAQHYAAAHQVFIIDYSHVPAIRPVVDALYSIAAPDFANSRGNEVRVRMAELRRGFRTLLRDHSLVDLEHLLSDEGLRKFRRQLLRAVRSIGGSYYGMIEGIYPTHLLDRRPLSGLWLQRRREIPCEIRVSDDAQTWAFEPSGIPLESDLHFRLEFQLPRFIAQILRQRSHASREGRLQWMAIAQVKREYLTFIDVSGMVEENFVNLRLTLDQDWLDQYVERRRQQERRDNE